MVQQLFPLSSTNSLRRPAVACLFFHTPNKMDLDDWEKEEQMYDNLEVQRESNPFIDCRMYENEFPEIDELVMVRVTRVTDVGAYVMLLEYNNKVCSSFLVVWMGMFSRFLWDGKEIEKVANLTTNSSSRKELFCCPTCLVRESDLSTGTSVLEELKFSKFSVSTLRRVCCAFFFFFLPVEIWGMLVLTRVIHAGYIDLSKKLIQKDDIIDCQERYKKSKTVHSILSRVAQNNGLFSFLFFSLLFLFSHTSSSSSEFPLLDLYEKVGWPLSQKYGHAQDAFQVWKKSCKRRKENLEKETEQEKKEGKEDSHKRLTMKTFRQWSKMRASALGISLML